MRKRLRRRWKRFIGRIAGGWRRVRPHLDAENVHGYGGTLLFAIGISAIYWPAGLIAAGLVLMWVAWKPPYQGRGPN